jgi:uncharacterized protein (TIGR00730 family)
MKITNVCVFCGASDKADQQYKDLAIKCGQMLAARNMQLIYGGGGSGLMGAVSKSVHQHGGKVTGIFPRLLGKFEPLSHDLDNTILVDSMSRRKDLMIEKSNAFLTLPGGFGTLDELFEVITLKILEQHEKPIIVVNHNHFWDEMIVVCDKIIKENFARDSARNCYLVVETLEEAFKLLES